MNRKAVAATALALIAGLSAAAHADEKVKVAYLLSNTYVPFLQAQKMGYFKKEGLDIEAVMLNNGPAEIAAVVSGSADVAMVAMVPAIGARSQGQPIKAFMTYNIEAAPTPNYSHFLASAKSGAKTMADLKGKTVAINAGGGGCDLEARDHLLAAGVSIDQVKVAVMPFPQIQAALELGTVDAACTVDPFYTSIMADQKIGAKELATGMFEGIAKTGAYAQDGYVATDEWLSKHQKTAAAFIRAINAATKDLGTNRPLYLGYLESEFKMPQSMTKDMMLDVNYQHPVALPKDYAAMIEAMQRTKMLAKPVKPEDFVQTIQP